MLVRSRRHQTPVAALFIDLDNFKRSTTRSATTPGTSCCGRRRAPRRRRREHRHARPPRRRRVRRDRGRSLARDAAPSSIAERLLEALEQPFTLGADADARLDRDRQHRHRDRRRASSAEDLLRDADIAMYQAKWDGQAPLRRLRGGMQDAVAAAAWSSSWTCASALDERRVLPRVPADLRSAAT